jgi:protein-tyrosine-phosphatase
MAEAITAARLRKSGLGKLAVSSAGTSAFEGMQAASNAVKVLGEIGIDLSGHRARLLTREMVDEADLIVVMTEAHRSEVLDLAPGSAGKVIVLGELDSSKASRDIADPMGGGEDAYRRTRDEIQELIPRLIEYLIEVFSIK